VREHIVRLTIRHPTNDPEDLVRRIERALNNIGVMSMRVHASSTVPRRFLNEQQNQQ
jgi:hypothetical protein